MKDDMEIVYIPDKGSTICIYKGQFTKRYIERDFPSVVRSTNWLQQLEMGWLKTRLVYELLLGLQHA